MSINREISILGSTHSTEVNAIAWSPKLSLLAFGGDDAKVEVYNFITRKFNYEYSNIASVKALTWSPDGNYLASGDDDGNIYVWDVSNRKELFSPFKINNNGVSYLEWSPDNSLLASASELDSRVQIWDTTKSYPENQVTTIYNPSGSWITGIAWSADGNDIATVGFDRMT